VFAGIASLVLVAAFGGTASAAMLHQPHAKLPKGPKIDPAKACTLLGRQQLRTFYAPQVVKRDKDNAGSPVTTDCAFSVGTPDAPVGRLVVNLVYPGFVDPGTNAIDVMESDRANAQLAGPGVPDLPLGKGGFVLKSRSLVEVAPSKKLAFTLQWLPNGGAPEGGPITDEVRKQLTVLAADIAKRGKHVS
jgi:hypothetical protein